MTRPLTPRRLDILRLVAQGRSNAEIGRELHLSEDAIKTHMQLTLRRLGARDRAHAVALGMARGLITATDIHPHRTTPEETP